MAGTQDSNLDADGQDDLDVKTEANDKSLNSLGKKPKTPEQIERERMRRRRRRQRQRIMRSLETEPDAEKNQVKPTIYTDVSADEKKLQVEKQKAAQKNEQQAEMKSNEQQKQKSEKDRTDVEGKDQEKYRADQHRKQDEAGRTEEIQQEKKEKEKQAKLQADEKKKDEEKRKTDEKRKNEEKDREQKKVEDQKALQDVASDQQLRDETYPKVLEGMPPPDMKFDKPVKDEEFGHLDVEKQKAEERRKAKESEQQQKKMSQEKQKNKSQKENEKPEKPKDEIQSKPEKTEEKPKIPEQKVKSDVSALSIEVEQPVPAYHAEPEYTTHSFAFDEPKDQLDTENPLSEIQTVKTEPEQDLAASDQQLMSELMDKVPDQESPEELKSAEESIHDSEQSTDGLLPKVEEEIPEITVEVDSQRDQADGQNLEDEQEKVEEDDTLVSIDSVVDEVPIFPSTEEIKTEVPSVDLNDELTFGDSKDQTEVPLIPIGKMREDHAGSTPDVQLPYENTPTIERESGGQEGPNLMSENIEPETKEAINDAEQKEKTVPLVEELNEKKAPAVDFAVKLAKILSEASKKVMPVVGNFFGNLVKFLQGIFGKLNIRMVGGIVAVVVVVGLGYFGITQKWHEQAWGFVSGTWGAFFKPKVEEPKVDVKPDVNDQRAFGITTALLFAENKGAVLDRLTPAISVALYYGMLQEPRVQGETGISAATYYGELRDESDFINVYVEYVNNLEHMQSLYKTDVYKLLDQTTKRDELLLKHLEELKIMKEKGLKIQEQLGIDLDDLKVSYESLNGEKSKGETDFFAALSDLQGEKSDTLLKQFIDASQKQVALKARIAALTKLQAYYVTALARLDKRFEAIDKNRDPLIQGIRVVDIPGADLDLIIHQ